MSKTRITTLIIVLVFLAVIIIVAFNTLLHPSRLTRLKFPEETEKVKLYKDMIGTLHQMMRDLNEKQEELKIEKTSLANHQSTSQEYPYQNAEIAKVYSKLHPKTKMFKANISHVEKTIASVGTVMANLSKEVETQRKNHPEIEAYYNSLSKTFIINLLACITLIIVMVLNFFVLKSIVNKLWTCWLVKLIGPDKQ